MNAATVAKATPAQITITGPEPLVIDPTDTKRRPALTLEEARLITSEILHTTSRLWLLVTEAHDRQAHNAMGYATWGDYARAELGMSPSRSYQLLDTGHVMRELAGAGVDIDSAKVPTARVVARVKDRLPLVRLAAAKAIKEGTKPEEAIKALAREPRMAVTAKVNGPTGAKVDGRKNALVRCPACSGQGKVPRSLAGKLRAFVKNA